MADAGSVLAAAVAERDHIAALIAAHEPCSDPWCPDCASLGKHLKRAQAQIDLLTPAETEAMFDG